MSVNQIFRGISTTEQIGRDQRLRSAWLAIPDALHSRPEPRSAWDSAARADCPTHPWDKLQTPIRAALQAAVERGNPLVIAKMRKKVEAFYAALLADALAPIPGASAECVLELSQSVTRENAEATIALQKVLAEFPALSPAHPPPSLGVAMMNWARAGQITVVLILLSIPLVMVYRWARGVVEKQKDAERRWIKERASIVPLKTSLIDETDDFDDSPPESLNQYVERTEAKESKPRRVS